MSDVIVVQPGATDANTDPLQQAIDAAPSGATLRLGAGAYTGPFVLDRSIRLVAEAGGQVTLSGAGRGSLLVVQGRGIEVALFGLVLSGGGDCNAGGAVSVPNGARVVLDGCTLRDCAASSYGGGGLFIRRGEASLRGCRFVSCSGRSGGGILVSNDATVRAADCTFVDCTAGHAGAVAAVRDRAELHLLGCDWSGCTPPEVVDPEAGWLVDVHTQGAVSTLERCKGARDGSALVSHTAQALKLIQPR
ncbi:MAG: hypothetical protein KC502_20345 [Myxococcales bacterium]|nr:hypothetical protein [Myxococcales bacterium]